MNELAESIKTWHTISLLVMRPVDYRFESIAGVLIASYQDRYTRRDNQPRSVIRAKNTDIPERCWTSRRSSSMLLTLRCGHLLT